MEDLVITAFQKHPMFEGISIDNCITRLRLEIKDMELVDDAVIRSSGALAVVRPGKNSLQVVIGTRVQFVADELKALLESDDTVIFVYTDDEENVMGYVFCMDKTYAGNHSTNPDKMLYIDDLCVDEKYRGRHIGQILCEYVKKYASEKGYQRITLNVWEFNKSARAFYDALGFEPLKTVMEMRL